MHVLHWREVPQVGPCAEFLLIASIGVDLVIQRLGGGGEVPVVVQNVGSSHKRLGNSRHSVSGTAKHARDIEHGLPEDAIPVVERPQLEDAVRCIADHGRLVLVFLEPAQGGNKSCQAANAVGHSAARKLRPLQKGQNLIAEGIQRLARCIAPHKCDAC